MHQVALRACCQGFEVTINRTVPVITANTGRPNRFSAGERLSGIIIGEVHGDIAAINCSGDQ